MGFAGLVLDWRPDSGDRSVKILYDSRVICSMAVIRRRDVDRLLLERH